MSVAGAAFLFVGLAYLIGAIPFAYLVVWVVKGVDIRTVGSGNVGATNAGRLLGFRYFLLIFAFDLLKGLLPTLLFPLLAARQVGREVDGLVVGVALATILGHNFPVYLSFRGGKGVATSLGAALAIDPIAGGVATLVFVLGLLATRMVSLSSILGALAYVVTYFVRIHGQAWDGTHRVTNVLILGLLGMLIVRHRANYARIVAGTEAKVNLPWCRKPPSGKVSVALLLGLSVAVVLVGGAAAVVARPSRLVCDSVALEVVARVETAHQRAGRLEFLEGGRRLAVCCPRYNRVVLYQISSDLHFRIVRDIPLEGRPVAVRGWGDRLYVLQRPTSDSRHVEAGWWETFDSRGQKVGERFRVGFDPDDLVVSADGRTAWVLLSGRAEGEANRPAPELLAVDLGDGSVPPRIRGHAELGEPEADPERIHLDSEGRIATVTFSGTGPMALVDVSCPDQPSLLRRVERVATASPDDLPPPAGVEAVELAGPAACRVWVQENDSCLSVREGSRGAVETLPLRGTANLGGIRPVGLAYSRERGLLAVSNRQGGSVHLIVVESRLTTSLDPE